MLGTNVLRHFIITCYLRRLIINLLSKNLLAKQTTEGKHELCFIQPTGQLILVSLSALRNFVLHTLTRFLRKEENKQTKTEDLLNDLSAKPAHMYLHTLYTYLTILMETHSYWLIDKQVNKRKERKPIEWNENGLTSLHPVHQAKAGKDSSNTFTPVTLFQITSQVAPSNQNPFKQ